MGLTVLCSHPKADQAKWPDPRPNPVQPDFFTSGVGGDPVSQTEEVEN